MIDAWDALRFEANPKDHKVLYTNRHAGLDPENPIFWPVMIVSFTSPPSLYPVSHSRVDTNEGEDFYMDDDDHDPEAENTTITTPGEFITSARAFMR